MKTPKSILICYLFLLCFGSLSAQDEKVISIGGESTWDAAEGRMGITEMQAIRPRPVLALASGLLDRAVDLPDMALSFDQERPDLFSDRAGRYTIVTAPGNGGNMISSVSPRWARMGSGAAFFSASAARQTGTGLGAAGPLVIQARDPEALFAPGQHIRDFSLEFWLYPLNVENGEQILSWAASRPKSQGGYYFQQIHCLVSKNHLQWNFNDFFAAPDGEGAQNIALSGSSPVVPKLWSHHLIRFDADTGLLEYLVNGRTEALGYTTAGDISTGEGGGEVYTPIVGTGGEFILGKGYTGIMDEFRVHGRYAGQIGREFSTEAGIQKYPRTGGRLETRAIDLGQASSAILRLDALGGRIALAGDRVRNSYAGQEKFNFTDNSAVQFFMRAGDNPYQWTDADWQVVTPGTELPPVFRGRYAQFAAVLYPSADGETSPYLEEVRIVYRPNPPPQPPTRPTIVARDGMVELNWRHSPSAEAEGYLVYYGTAAEDYFGRGALRGPSPIDAGKRNTLRIEGLDNGTLYYFAIAAYSRTVDGEFRVGEFSREVTARPLLEYTAMRYE